MFEEPDRTFVMSGNIAAAGYSETAEVLTLEFFNGALYHYYDVSPELATKLFSADDFMKAYRMSGVSTKKSKLVQHLLPIYLG